MSIQQKLNQAIAIGGALYSQSATAELRKTEALEKREVAKIDKAIEGLEANMKETEDQVESMAKYNPSSSERIMQAGIERTQEIQKRSDKLAERRAEITGDYSDVSAMDIYKRSMQVANETAQAKVEAKKMQMENMYNKLDEEQKYFVDRIENPAKKKEAIEKITGGNK